MPPEVLPKPLLSGGLRVGLGWEGRVSSSLWFQVHVLLPYALCYQHSQLIPSSLQKRQRWGGASGSLAAEQAWRRCESWGTAAPLLPGSGWRTNSLIAVHCWVPVVVVVASLHQNQLQCHLCTMSLSFLPLFKGEWIILCEFTRPFTACSNSAA